MSADNKTGRIDASPTKRFFVDMLTRDIELKDAVLDLLDNCVDGLMRTLGKDVTDEDRPYEGYWAELTFGHDRFEIRDNCGGISRKLAMESAFRLGRPKNASPAENNLPTVGTYGIGMKRAIFKIGRQCEIVSRTSKESFTVKIPKRWFSDEKDWSLSLSSLRSQPDDVGTSIILTELLDEVKNRFEDPTGFEEEFRQTVSEQYSVIIAKGFQVKIQGKNVDGLTLQLRTVDLAKYKGGLAPFMYAGTVDDVHVALQVGFYKHAQDEAELDEMMEREEYSAEEAGWTVICNDRVVIYRDKGRLTGWGEAGVPSFHNQFNSIAGVVHFRCNDASKLPVNTTKRGIDPGSELYMKIKDRMREGLKKFTSYTNKLKKVPEKRAEVFSSSVARDVHRLELPSSGGFVRADKKLGGKIFDPELPVLSTSTLRTIRFSRDAKDIQKIATRLLDNPDATPSEVGEFCFDRTLRSLDKK
jgi:hypothetical protein